MKKYLIDMKIERNKIGEICSIDNIKIIHINEWMETLYGEKADQISLNQTCEDLRRWCSKNNATYYNASEKNFYIRDGYELAKREGKSTVIIEQI